MYNMYSKNESEGNIVFKIKVFLLLTLRKRICRFKITLGNFGELSEVNVLTNSEIIIFTGDGNDHESIYC